MSKGVEQWTRKELLALPRRESWKETGVYGSLVLIPTRRLHSSGYRMITVVGVRDFVPIEILTECSDDISISNPEPLDYSFLAVVRMDCLKGSSCLHLHHGYYEFNVGPSLSSLEITLQKIKKQE